MSKAAVAAVLALCAGPAFAQGFEGGEVGLNFDHNFGDYTQGNLHGSGTFGITPSLFTQVDLGYMDRGDSFGGQRSIGGHLGYRLGSGAVGGFLGFEDWPAHSYRSYGVEAKADVGAVAGADLTLEGYLVRFEQTGGGYDFSGGGVDTAWKVTPASTLKAGFFTGGGDLNSDRVSVGVNYATGGGFDIGLEAGHIFKPGSDDNTVGLNLSYKFGQGSTFGTRNFPTFIPAN